jgi:hypothetical protein
MRSVSPRWPKDWTHPRPRESSATDKPPSPAFLTRAGEHAQTLHERFFSNLRLPHLQLDALRTRLRSYKQVVWLWLAIDPCTKILPVLQLGPRTQHMAHLLIHSLRQRLAAFLPPPFHQRWLKPVLLCVDSSFWTLAPGESPRPESTPVASGGRADLWSGEAKLPATQTGASHACDAPGDRGSSHKREASDGFLWTTQHRFH